MIRNILAVIVGYLIFVVSAVLLFQLTGQKPHGETSTAFMIFVVLYGAVFATVGGFIAQIIAKSKTLIINYILALMMAGFAAFSLFKTDGNHYTQIAAIFLFAPLSVLGGYLYLRKKV
jgi:nitrate/nitrite transporter NarK